MERKNSRKVVAGILLSLVLAGQVSLGASSGGGLRASGGSPCGGGGSCGDDGCRGRGDDGEGRGCHGGCCDGVLAQEDLQQGQGSGPGHVRGVAGVAIPSS